jgi:hypothetical protein
MTIKRFLNLIMLYAFSYVFVCVGRGTFNYFEFTEVSKFVLSFLMACGTCVYLAISITSELSEREREYEKRKI